MTSKKIIVTGGAGFIGSHLVDKLVAQGNEVLVIDNLCSGKKENLAKNPNIRFLKSDIRRDLSSEFASFGAETVFHLAADPNVRSSAIIPLESFDQNVVGTLTVLESARKADIKEFVLASTSTVYGDAKIPTKEEEICQPISNYGASKLAAESYVSSYSHSYSIKGTSLRFANIFGERSEHGVMFDFYTKLKKNPKQLEILGNGKQEKSYLHVTDAIEATIAAWKKQTKLYDVFNVGSMEKVITQKIAEIIAKQLKLTPKFTYTGGDRGWVGDVKTMLLDTSKIRKLGWDQKTTFESGLANYVTWLSEEK